MGRYSGTMRPLAMILLFGLFLSWPLAGTGLTQAEAPGVSMGAESDLDSVGDEEEVEDVGWLTIFFDPNDTELRAPGEILLTDPLRRRVGWAITENKAVAEIAGSFYEEAGLDDDETGEAGPTSKELVVRAPVEGKYLLNVIGTAPRVYGLSIHIMSADLDAPSQDASVQDVPIKKGEIHLYEFTYLAKNTGELVLKRVR